MLDKSCGSSTSCTFFFSYQMQLSSLIRNSIACRQHTISVCRQQTSSLRRDKVIPNAISDARSKELEGRSHALRSTFLSPVRSLHPSRVERSFSTQSITPVLQSQLSVTQPANGIVNGTANVGIRKPELFQSIVKVFATSTTPNFSMPWQMRRQTTSTSSGFAIAGKKIITNAHSVADQTSVTVRKHGCPDKFIARVVVVGHECDLAMLSVEDEAFWTDVVPLELGSLPQLQEQVSVVGYPTGGDNICVTAGVVSRIEVQTYSHSMAALPAVQIDAAINSGNSGGPAIAGDGKVVGVAFETLQNAQNVGYVIPVSVIQHFLEDYNRHEKYTGFCSLGFLWQAMENSQFRRACGMAPLQTGVFISRVEPISSCGGILERGDVLLEVDGISIANDGTIIFRNSERILFRQYLSTKFISDIVELKIIRNSKLQTLKITCGTLTNLVKVHMHDVVPSFFIFGGIVFVELTQPYLRSEYGKDWERAAPVKLCLASMYGSATFPDERIVVVSQVLAHDSNVGFQTGTSNIQLESFNGTKIRNIKHLVELVMTSNDEFARFDLENGKAIVLEVESANSSNEAILRQHHIPSQMSPDLQKITEELREAESSKRDARIRESADQMLLVASNSAQ
mmetsp:Transcript_39712/g.64406  ORF Transcript_39712/g.64406 Transcript_39712/m.64406 type:complete len:625 (+) Transcript_39712:172-2046(+)|eukprot:CAMPEP_0184646510 /NCGR_PEP_ID=MMETSP0308-20130426/3209_1 /TAXON_ID=38269 /ORGANISM="Gloeochaete witrockiana, Strain SAG 46.84" /LENGTH=624 /DNA_ID=CAMNT_0027076571 /DNA_START=88 /DNA_END=1962 /DNA_ORIENTATION=+